MAARSTEHRSLREIVRSTNRATRYRYYWQGSARRNEVIDRCARCDIPFRRPGDELAYEVFALCPTCARRAHDRLIVFLLLFLFVGGLGVSLSVVV